MKPLLVIMVLASIGLSTALSSGPKPLTYYVQLIRCSEKDQPPEPRSKPIGPKLAEKFKCVFRCKSYWEINQQAIELVPNHIGRARLGNGREVEIDLTRPGKRRVSTFHNGRLIERTVEPLGESMTLIGGDRDQTSHWFIVVRRDRPGQ